MEDKFYICAAIKKQIMLCSIIRGILNPSQVFVDIISDSGGDVRSRFSHCKSRLDEQGGCKFGL